MTTLRSDKLELTKDEVEAIQGYVWWHVRATNGLAKKTWDKMFAFIQDEDVPVKPVEEKEVQGTLF